MLLNLSEWLAKSYQDGEQLSGVLYLHQLTDDRPNASDLRNLRILKKICGSEFYRHIVIGVTGVDEEDHDVAENREKALKDSSDFWKDMITEGSRVEHVKSQRQKCIDILLDLATRGPNTLLIQREVHEENKTVLETEAADEIRSYTQRRAIRDAEELERITEYNRHEADLQKLKQQAIAMAYESETSFRELQEEQNDEIDLLATRKADNIEEQRRYTEALTRRTAAFEQQKLAVVVQEDSLKPQRLLLEKEHAERLETIESTKLRRRIVEHIESLAVHRTLLEKLSDTDNPQQPFKYVSQEYNDRSNRHHEQIFCGQCLDQISLFGTSWGKPRSLFL